MYEDKKSSLQEQSNDRVQWADRIHYFIAGKYDSKTLQGFITLDGARQLETRLMCTMHNMKWMNTPSKVR